jgi:hypothetical protein
LVGGVLELAVVEVEQEGVVAHMVVVKPTAAATATTTTTMTPRPLADLALIPTLGLTRLTTARAGITSEDEEAGMPEMVAVAGTMAIDREGTFKDKLRSCFSECHHKLNHSVKHRSLHICRTNLRTINSNLILNW